MSPGRGSFRRLDGFVVGVLLCGCVYAGLGWSPSSYGTVLEIFDAGNIGLIAGRPRAVRSDESRIWTPYIQIALNNGFQRFNRTSVYGEDLRSFVGLPLADWSAVLKPYVWLFFIAPGWLAFSVYHTTFIVLFLVGYYYLFIGFKFDRTAAALASLCLFFTSFVQMWWTTVGPVLAGFPWLLILVDSRLSVPSMMLVLVYVTASWLFAYLYPPIIVTLVFITCTFRLVHVTGAMLRRLSAAAVAASAGAAIVAVYLRTAIPITAATEYPGQRIIHGGGLPLSQWFAQFFPFLVTTGFNHHVALNVCEASTVGSYLLILVLSFFDYRQAGRIGANLWWPGHAGPVLLLLLFGFCLTSAWELAPIPAGVGRVLLWHLVSPRSMLFASGLLLFVLSLLLTQLGALRLTWPRLIVAACVIAAVSIGWKAFKWNVIAAESYADLFVLFPLAIGVVLRAHLRPSHVLIGSAAIANAVAFAGFNPIQNARPIFNRPVTLRTQHLAALQQRHPRGWLISTEPYGGAILNGWGFRSVEHTLLTPQLAFWRGFFPEMPAAEFKRIFNRYGHIILSDTPRPVVDGPDVIYVPLERFAPVAPRVDVVRSIDGLAPSRGAIDQIVEEAGAPNRIRLFGWAPSDVINPNGRLVLRTDVAIDGLSARPTFRPDVTIGFREARYIVHGFELRLTVKDRASVDRIRRSICIVSEDPNVGRFMLSNATAPAACRDVSPLH